MELRELIEALDQAHIYKVSEGEHKGVEYVAISTIALDLVVDWLEICADLVEGVNELENEMPDDGVTKH